MNHKKLSVKTDYYISQNPTLHILNQIIFSREKYQVIINTPISDSHNPIIEKVSPLITEITGKLSMFNNSYTDRYIRKHLYFRFTHLFNEIFLGKTLTSFIF